jgi:hypothetical protein
MTVRIVWRVGVFSRAGVAMMGSVEVTTLHPRGSGDLVLPLVLEVGPPSLDDSSRAVCRQRDPLWTIPMKMAPESHSWGERLSLPMRSVVNSMLPKRRVLSGARLRLLGLLLLATKQSFDEGTIKTSTRKACYKSPFLAHQLSVFFVPARYRVVKIARSYSYVVL